MRIISQTKDYYDHIGHVYGGGDPKIVYERKPFENINTLININKKSIAPLYDVEWKLQYMLKNGFEKYSTKWIFIAGKVYSLVADISSQTPTYKIITLFPEVLDSIQNKYKWFLSRKYSIDDVFGLPCNQLIEVSRQLHSPVFVFTFNGQTRDNYLLMIQSTVPKLSDYGFPSVIPAEQMYQDISYYMGNTINPSPDVLPTPKPPMTNDEKIASHGFDKKTSFRHRK